MAGSPKGADDSWPSPTELEQWLFSCAAETDQDSTGLRKLLQTNPSLHASLVSDEVLAETAQLFAKRFRKAASTPGVAGFIRPICELIWRTVGSVVCSIAGLEGASGSFQSIMKRDVSGHLKMLLKANEDLSNEFKKARRNFLVELAVHRSRRSAISEEAASKLRDLEERPVMFYEPLKTILDEPTKEFIREVIADRMRAELKTVFPAPVKKEEPEPDDEGADAKALMLRLKELEEVHQKTVEESKRQRQLAQERLEELKKLREELAQAQQQLQQKEDELQGVLEQAQGNEQAQRGRGSSEELMQQLRAESSRAAELEAQLLALQQEKDSLVARLQEETARNQQLSEQIAKLQKDLAIMENDSAGAASKSSAAPRPADNSAQLAAANSAAEAAKAARKAAEDALNEHLEAERRLRESNASLEKALADALRRAKEAEAAAKAKETATATKNEPVQSRAGGQQQSGKEAELHQEIEALKAQLKKLSEAPKAKPKDDGQLEQQLQEWKRKHQELHERVEGLQEERDRLEAKVNALLAQMREKLGDDAVKSMMAKVDAGLPVMRLSKKKVFERLWDDAQRRIKDVKAKTEGLLEAQREVVEDAASFAAETQSHEHVKMLSSLQQAAAATAYRFHSAVQQYHTLYQTHRFSTQALTFPISERTSFEPPQMYSAATPSPPLRRSTKIRPPPPEIQAPEVVTWSGSLTPLQVTGLLPEIPTPAGGAPTLTLRREDMRLTVGGKNKFVTFIPRQNSMQGSRSLPSLSVAGSTVTGAFRPAGEPLRSP